MNRRHRKRRGSGFVRGLFVFLLLLLALYVFLGREERPASVPSWEPIPGETAEEAGTEGPAAEETETAGEEESSSVSLYCRSLLSDADRAMYDRILEGITSGEETEVPTLDPDALSRVYTSVMADHPEIFYTDGYTYTTYRSFGATRALSFTARYTVSDKERTAYQSAIDAAVEEILQGAPKDGGDFAKILYVYNTIIQNTAYDTGAAHNQDIYSVFVLKKSVCSGYAKAAQLLLQKLGIETALVTGTAQGGAHAWDLVLADGDWTYVDPTWGDAEFLDQSGASSEDLSGINYDYLCVTTEDLSSTHSFGVPYALPDCTATKDNYYVHEGLYFTRYDKDQLAEIAQQAEQTGQGVLRLRCADDAVFQKMKADLVDGRAIYSYLPGSSSLRYSEDDSLHTLSFYLEG